MAPVVWIVVVLVVIVIAGAAWLLYRAGFRAREVTFRAGPVEARMERNGGDAPSPAAETSAPRTEAAQRATGGGSIEGSTIEAPAASGASVRQEARDEGRIENSHIKLD